MVLSPAVVQTQLGQGHFSLICIIQSLFRELEMNRWYFQEVRLLASATDNM